MNPGIRLSLQTLAETARRDSSEQLRRLARDLTDAVPDIPGKVRALVDALHRSGARSVSVIDADDACLFVATAARHRREAFQAADHLMDYLKSRAPFWKREHGPDGARWIEPTETDVADAARWD